MLDRHTLSSRQKTAAAFANRVLISASTSPSLDITLGESFDIYSMFPCATAIGCDDGRWVREERKRRSREGSKQVRKT